MALRLLFTRNMSLLWLIDFGMTISITSFNVLMPLYIQSAGFGAGANGFILGITSLGMLVSLLVMGPVIDRGDSRHFMLLGGLGWALGALLALLPPLAPLLALCRFAQGFGFAIFLTSLMVHATRSIPLDLRGTVVGMSEAVGGASIALTPFLAVWMQAQVGFRGTFTAAAALGLGASLLALLLDHQARPAFDTTRPAKPARLLSTRALLPGLVAGALFFAAASYISLAPLIAQRLGVVYLSVYMGLRALCTVPTRFFSGMLSDRRGGAWTIVPGFVLSALAMLVLQFFQSGPWVYLTPVLLGLGMGAASPALTNWILRRVDASEHAVAINTLSLLSQGSGFFGTWIAGLLLQNGILPGFVLAFVLAGGLVTYYVVGGFTPLPVVKALPGAAK
jgi:MFS family permease